MRSIRSNGIVPSLMETLTALFDIRNGVMRVKRMNSETERHARAALAEHQRLKERAARLRLTEAERRDIRKMTGR